MLTTPDLYNVVYGERGMLGGVRACLHAQCLVSAVTLMYATIDAVSALTRPMGDRETTRTVFLAWVQRFVPLQRLAVTELELYGARCGVLHTYRPEAAVVQGGVRPIYYQWREGPAADSERAMPANAAFVVVEDLYEALEAALREYVAILAQDQDLADRLNDHVGDLLHYRPYVVDAAPRPVADG